MAELPGMQLSKVHAYLRQELRPCSSQHIFAATGVDIEASSELLLSLLGAGSKVRREPDARWRWKSRHYLTGLNDLLHFFSMAEEGVVEAVLLDSYRGVKDDLAKLKANGGVYALKSGSKTVLHRRDRHLETEVSEPVRNRYNRVSVPDAIEVDRYLVREGLKDSSGGLAGSGVGALVPRKRPRKKGETARAKRVKLTNTHMTNSGIDLSKDYKHGKGSAFS
jgi:hypothetical protein